MRPDPLELRTLAEVQRQTSLDGIEVLEDIVAGRLQTVWLGLDPRVPQAELDRYIAERLATPVE